MFHNRNTALKTAFSALLLSSAALAAPANATLYTPEGRTTLQRSSLAEIDGLEARMLDWRNPSLEFRFDATETEWTDKLELLLTADPVGKVSRRTPLMVQFNNGKPTPVITRGRGFDARIQLDKTLIRPRNNIIRFTYDAPVGAACLAPQHGAWRLDFKNSMIIRKARSKAQDYDIRDVEARLKNPMTAPKSVRILARGENTPALQALAAQGVGLRMTDIPQFKTNSGHSEFEVVLGRRDQLNGWVRDQEILQGSGPRILVHEGRPLRLVITGDTDEDVLETAKSFATFKLPDGYRAVTSLGEMNMQLPLGHAQNRVDGTSKLSAISGTTFERSWGPRPQQISFDVKDPMASTGEVILRLASGKAVSDDSRVALDLNGKSLGYVKLDKSRKSVGFEIPAGTLQGMNNVLSITPELEVDKLDGCNFVQDLPSFYLGAGSKITINNDAPSLTTELSTLTATGAPFSLDKGSDTVVMLPASSGTDYNASLKVLAKLAKASGYGWTDADYLRATNFDAVGNSKNVLVIGPSHRIDRRARQGAPKGLSSALKGQSLIGTGRIASIDRFAANDEATTLQLYASRQAQTGRINSGGVAALYPSPFADGKVMGVITNTPGRGFSTTAKQLVQPKAWNALEGSVARWDGRKVIMAQTAMAVPGFIAPETDTPKFDILKTPLAALSNINWPEINLPKFDREAFEFNDIDTRTVSEKLEGLKVKVASLLAGRQSQQIASPRLKPLVNTAAVPQLRGLSKVPATPKILKLKSWAVDKTAAIRQAWTKFDLRGSVDTMSTKLQSAQWRGQNLSALALIFLAAFAFFILLGRLIKPRKN